MRDESNRLTLLMIIALAAAIVFLFFMSVRAHDPVQTIEITGYTIEGEIKQVDIDLDMKTITIWRKTDHLRYGVIDCELVARPPLWQERN